MALSLLYWSNYTSGEVKMQRKSEQAVEANHVLKFTFDQEARHVKSVVQASMRDKAYRVEIELNDAFGVQSTCECPLGNFHCHHVAAALLYGYKNVSKTDVPCSWMKRPKSSRPTETRTIEQLYPHSKSSYRALGRDVTQEDQDQLYGQLSQLGRFTALQWIMSPEPSTCELPVPLVEDLLMNEDYLAAPCPLSWLRRHLLLNKSSVEQVAEVTKGQRTNHLWCSARKLRLTASNFGAVLSAVKSKRFCKSLKQRLVCPYNLETVKSVAWGIHHETTALDEYRATGAVVEQTGIWLHESGVLGASPDGVVQVAPQNCTLYCQDETAATKRPDIVEVKCPYSARDMTISEATAKVKGFFIDQEGGCFVLNKNHAYYHQVQGQLYVMGKDCCDFLVWTKRDFKILRIAKDVSWAENIGKLVDFYFTTFIPTFV